MTISRRQAISISGSTLAGLSFAALRPRPPGTGPGRAATGAVAGPARRAAAARRFSGAPSAQPGWLSARAHGQRGRADHRSADVATANRQAPEIEFDYQKMQIKVDTRGLAKLTGTLQFSDLEKLPRGLDTFLMQCGAANPRGVVKWTGVRFTDFADMLGLIPGAHYCRLVASDRQYVDETDGHAQASASHACLADERRADLRQSTARHCGSSFRSDTGTGASRPSRR